MSYMVFKLLFAALVLGLIVVAGLTVREIRRKRLPGAPKPRREDAPIAPKLGKPALPEETAEPVPEAPAPARRRQLHSFAEAERSAAETVALPQPLADPEIDPEIEPVQPPEAEPPAAPEPDYGQAVLGRLEEAFEALQAGTITLDAYRTRVLAEQAAVERRIAEMQAGGDSAELDAALAARESVRWCLDWAAEQAGAPEG